MDTQHHWDDAYAGGDRDRSWYQAQAEVSLELIAGAPASASVIDVGGGASTLVDGLLTQGRAEVAVLDVSLAGLTIARERLGTAADSVIWIQTDLLRWEPDRHYGVWHDRAVLHFLVDESDRHRYHATLNRATDVGSMAVIGVFGPQGPARCSGLPVRRFDETAMAEFLGPYWAMADSFLQTHRTPAGREQQFLWTVAVRTA